MSLFLFSIFLSHNVSVVHPEAHARVSRMVTAFAALPQLVLGGYRPTTFDYDPGRDTDPGTLVTKEQWVEVFRSSIPEFSKRAASDLRVPNSQDLSRQFAAQFGADLDSVTAGDHTHLFKGAPTVLKLCALRDKRLRDAGFADCFAEVKKHENEKALKQLPGVLAEIDAIQDREARILTLVQGVFAGNVFDLGAAASAELHAERDRMGKQGKTDFFHKTRAGLKKKPWCVDDFDLFSRRWLSESGDASGDAGDGDDTSATGDAGDGDNTSNTSPTVLKSTSPTGDVNKTSPTVLGTSPTIIKSPWRKVLMFVDNAGADVVLGMFPLAREFLRGGAAVILAANETPSINDVTARELREILSMVCAVDEIFKTAFNDGSLQVVSSGSDLPVIDLTKLSTELCELSLCVDLVVLEGMGRAVETNLHAKFTCDALNLGMVKHPEVATCLNGSLYDCVCRFR